ncbi:hypothetical protein ACHQM5_026770 [Ranunculus cassubicifolius]
MGEEFGISLHDPRDDNEDEDDDDEEYDDEDQGNRMLGNVDNAGDLDVDYLDEAASDRMEQVFLSGDVSAMMNVNMQFTTLGHVRDEAALRLDVDRKDINLIHRGRRLKYTDDSRNLLELQIKHSSKIIAVKVYMEGTVVDQIKRAASAFYKSHKECSVPAENIYINIEDDDARAVYHSETERRNVMAGLVLNQKAQRLLKNKKLEEALVVLKLAKPEDCSVCKGDPSNKFCLKCGNPGHLMFFCPNDYNRDDLKDIQCYVCHEYGHFCCKEPVVPHKGEISCCKCGKPGHEICGHQPGPVALSSCYKCGKVGHYGEICPQPLKIDAPVIKKGLPIEVCVVTIDFESFKVDILKRAHKGYNQLNAFLTELVFGATEAEKIFATFTIGDREDEDEKVLGTIPYNAFFPSVIYVMPDSFRDLRLWKSFIGAERC